MRVVPAIGAVSAGFAGIMSPQNPVRTEPEGHAGTGTVGRAAGAVVSTNAALCAVTVVAAPPAVGVHVEVPSCLSSRVDDGVLLYVAPEDVAGVVLYDVPP